MTRTRRWSLLLAIGRGHAGGPAGPGLRGAGGAGGYGALARTTTPGRLPRRGRALPDLVHLRRRRGQVGSIVPLPGVPGDVRKGGEWTLQRLVRETQPQPPTFLRAAAAAEADKATELLKTRVDALDITVLKGGGRTVGLSTSTAGFGLSVDAPEGTRLLRHPPAPSS